MFSNEDVISHSVLDMSVVYFVWVRASRIHNGAIRPIRNLVKTCMQDHEFLHNFSSQRIIIQGYL